MADVNQQQVVDYIKGITVMELSQLVKALETELGVSAAAAMPMAMPMGGAAPGGAAAVEEQTEFTVTLTEVGAAKINVIKVVREVTSLGLKERLVNVTLRYRDVGVKRLHQLGHRFDAFGIALERLERRHANHRHIVAREAIALEKLAHFEFDEVHQFRVVHGVDLVEGDDEVRDVHLAGEQHVLARLRHRAVDAADHENRTVHLRRARDHVLDVVGMARAVDVRVVPVRRAVFHVARRDRQNLGVVAASLRLRGLGDLVVGNELRPPSVRRNLGQRRGERGLSVVDVTNGANVDVGFGPIEFLFRHDSPSLASCRPGPVPASGSSLLPVRLGLPPDSPSPCGLRRSRALQTPTVGLPTVARTVTSAHLRSHAFLRASVGNLRMNQSGGWSR